MPRFLGLHDNTTHVILQFEEAVTVRNHVVFSVFFLSVFATSLWAQSAKPRLAILELKADTGVPVPAAKTVTRLLNDEIVNSGLFTVVERGDISKVMKEQAFQKSGCVDTTCAVQVGQLLSARKIVIGNVSRLGSKIFIFARLVAGNKIISGSRDGTLKIWDLNSCTLIQTLTGHTGGVRDVAVSDKHGAIVSGSNDHTIRLWKLNTGELLRKLTGHGAGVTALAIDSTNSYLASGSADKTIKLWDMKTGDYLGNFD